MSAKDSYNDFASAQLVVSFPRACLAVNQRRLELLQADWRTTTHEEGVLVIDDTGDRKSRKQTAHVGRQYLGSIGKIDNGLVVVSTLWADEERYYPLHAEPYPPARRLPKGKADVAFRTKPRIALQLRRRSMSESCFARLWPIAATAQIPPLWGSY